MILLTSTALVAGAGPAGLVAACLLARAGVDTIICAPAASHDPRTVALMSASITLLENLGIWTKDLRGHCAPLRHLHMRDDTGNLVSAPDVRFSANEAGLDAFGWNIPLAELMKTLLQQAKILGVRFLQTEILTCAISHDGVQAECKSGERVAAQFAVAADGRNSLLRKAAGISAKAWSFDQLALVTRFTHSQGHDDTSTEWHKRGGLFTTVPLPANRSAVVWMDKPNRIDAIVHLSPQELAREIQLQIHGTLGLVSDVQPPHSFPMRGVQAEHFAAHRTYLIGEAAHVFPPVGAQGLNMSLRDAGHMADVVLQHADPGSDDAMHAFESLRRPDVIPRQFGISLMNRSLMADIVPPHLARAAGLAAISLIPPLRKLAIREGLSPAGGLPSSMQPANG